MIKLTKKMALEVAINAIENSTLPNWSYSVGEETLTISKADAIEKIQKMIESLDNKANTPKKPTKVQQENESLKQAIAEMLEGESPKTISEMLAMGGALEGLSNQKVASIVRSMVNDGKLVRIEEKRKAYFALA